MSSTKKGTSRIRCQSQAWFVYSVATNSLVGWARSFQWLWRRIVAQMARRCWINFDKNMQQQDQKVVGGAWTAWIAQWAWHGLRNCFFCVSLQYMLKNDYLSCEWCSNPPTLKQWITLDLHGSHTDYNTSKVFFAARSVMLSKATFGSLFWSRRVLWMLQQRRHASSSPLMRLWRIRSLVHIQNNQTTLACHFAYGFSYRFSMVFLPVAFVMSKVWWEQMMFVDPVDVLH